MSIIYFGVALLATTLGAVAGLGGGVIIKPVLDCMGAYPVETISLLSSCTVFAMAVVSIGKQLQYQCAIDAKKAVLLGIGSVIGGVTGDWCMDRILSVCSGQHVMLVQNSMLAVQLIFVYLYMNRRDRYTGFQISQPVFCLGIGWLLGAIAAFLGIGGGPINIGILILCFSMNPKEAAVNSLFIILFSQGAKLMSVIAANGFAKHDLSMLPYMVAAGIIGGGLGARLHKRIAAERIVTLLNALLILLISLALYNVATAGG